MTQTTEQKAYKCYKAYNHRMFPSDPTGSLDDFYFSFLGGKY